MGSVTLALLAKDAKAVKYRPPEGATPWYKKSSVGELEDPNYPYDYVVPNFGVDSEIEVSNKNLAAAEQSVGQEMKASFKTPKGHPVDYKVPNFGTDKDIIVSLGNLKQSEDLLKHKWVPPSKAQLKAAEYDKDYFVPNFGKDHDIKVSLNNLSQSEKLLNHTWVPPTKKELKDAEYDKDYFVPNFGADEDIKMTQKHIKEQEKLQKHEWKPVQDENGVWIVPEANKSNKSLLQTDADIKIESDPICSSAGCNYAKDKGKTPHPMNYFVPNFGRDRDINTSFNSLDWAENEIGHHWEVDFKAMKDKGPKRDYFVPNFGVDEDIKMTQSHIKEQEKKLKHEWKPVEDENGVWIVPEANANSSYTYKSLVQTDADIKMGSDPVCSSAGCNYAKDKGKTPYPMNYFVPNFGRDRDINTTWSSLDWAEQSLDHKFDPMSKKEAKKLEHDIDYPVPDFGLDEDVVQTQAHIAEQEKLKKHKWTPKQDENGIWIVPEANSNDSYSYRSLVQTGSEINLGKKHKKHHRHSQEEQSDPICSSAGYPCEQNKKKAQHKVDYKVPDFGVDQDIIQTQKHIAEQEKKQNHKWVPKKDENGVYQVPTARLAQIKSDPVCHSAGCPKSKWFGNDEKNKHVLYDDLVKKYGYDEDIVDSVGNEMIVSKAMGIPFTMPMYAQIESDPVCHSAGCTQYTWMDALRKKQGDPPVEYDTNQSLDGDIINTWNNLDVAEKIKNHEWKFNQDVYDKRNDDDTIEYNFKAKLDDDIVNTQSHLNAAEKKMGNWDIFKDKNAKK